MWTEAITDCENAIKHNSKNVKAFILLARACANKSKETKSAKLAKEALEHVRTAIRLAKLEQNEDFVTYCKELRKKVKSIVWLQRAKEGETERDAVLKYYSELLEFDEGNQQFLTAVSLYRLLRNRSSSKRSLKRP